MEIFYVPFRTICSKMEHLVQNGPGRKNDYFQKPMVEMEFMCPRKMGTKIFQNFIEVILAMKVKYAKTNHQILQIFEMCNLKVSNMINFNRN